MEGQNQYNNMNRNNNGNMNRGYNIYGNGNTKILITIVILIVLFMIFRKEGVSMLYSIPALLIALSVHEAAHAYTANKYGDSTSKDRISLNPLKHIDLLGLLSLLTLKVGWGKPVSINPRNFSGSRKEMDRIEARVAFAGPLSNLITAFIFSFIYVFLIKINVLNEVLNTMMLLTIGTNIGLGLFNLIPIPPLDGYKIFRPMLSSNVKDFLDKNEDIIGLIWIVIIASGVNLSFIQVGIGKLSGLMLALWLKIFGIM